MFNDIDAHRASDTAQILQFNDHYVLRPERSWVRELIEEVRATLADRIAAQEIRVDIDVPLNESVYADRGMLRQCLANLLANALDAMPCGGDLVITSYKGPTAFELEVADSGSGVTSELRKKVFEPYFTTKRGAAGLGLSIVRRCVDAHGGQVLVHNCPEGGAAFTLRIPSRAREAAA